MNLNHLASRLSSLLSTSNDPLSLGNDQRVISPEELADYRTAIIHLAIEAAVELPGNDWTFWAEVAMEIIARNAQLRAHGELQIEPVSFEAFLGMLEPGEKPSAE